MIFSKSPRTPKYLAHKLISNGLREVSEIDLTDLFQSINYYKLRGYTYPYQDNTVLKTRMTLVSLTFGATWYLNNRLFKSQNAFNSDFAFLQSDWNRASEEFKNHYETKYPESPNPPAWMIFETSSFGPISKFFKNMKPQLAEKESICNYFGFEKADGNKLATWFQVINTVRNICAHHGRLYSRHLITTPLFVVPRKGNWVSSWPNPNRVYAAICIIKNFLDICNPNNTFVAELKELMKMVRPEQLPSMGFPADWKIEPLFS